MKCDRMAEAAVHGAARDYCTKFDERCGVNQEHIRNCNVFGTSLADESAADFVRRVDLMRGASPLLPFTFSEEVFAFGRDSSMLCSKRQREEYRNKLNENRINAGCAYKLYHDSDGKMDNFSAEAQRHDDLKRAEKLYSSGLKGVVEICGVHSAGKTTCCIHAACICLLPQELGGLERGVLYIDCDGKFDLFRLVQILEFEIESRLEKRDERMNDCLNCNSIANDLESIFKKCLGRMFLVKCWNSLQLLATTFYINSNFEKMIVRISLLLSLSTLRRTKICF